MIDIKRNRYLDPIKEYWRESVKNFFINTDCHPYITFKNGKRRYFNSYLEKLKYECLQVVFDNTMNNKWLRKIYVRTLIYWWNQIDYIILVPPSVICSIVKIWDQRSGGSIQLQGILSKIFTHYYERVSCKFGEELISKLNIKTCPYCNRQFIYTYKGHSIERPELDHFFPKAKYPLFCLSFYNLIPACHSCNHVKSSQKIGKNPYFSAFKGKFVLIDKKNCHKLNSSQIYRLSKNEIEIDFEGCDGLENDNVKILGLKNVYNKHIDYIKELIDKSMAYDEYAKKNLVESFQGVGYYPRQVYDFVWGRHLSDAEYEDRPLSKLTKDILDILNIRRDEKR